MAAAGGAHGRILLQRAAYMDMLTREPCVFICVRFFLQYTAPLWHLEKPRFMIFLNI